MISYPRRPLRRLPPAPKPAAPPPEHQVEQDPSRELAKILGQEEMYDLMKADMERQKG